LPAGDDAASRPGGDTDAGGDVKGQVLIGEFVHLHPLPKPLAQGQRFVQ
jgi:hypothetical protein